MNNDTTPTNPDSVPSITLTETDQAALEAAVAAGAMVLPDQDSTTDFSALSFDQLGGLISLVSYRLAACERLLDRLVTHLKMHNKIERAW